jgi:hypothetical protein
MGVGLDPRAQRRNGSLIPVAVTLSPIDLGPGLGTIAVVRMGEEPAAPASGPLDAPWQDRERLAAGLQSIVGHLFDAGMVLHSLPPTARSTVEERIDEALEELNRAIHQLQSVALDLMAPPEPEEP